MLPSLSVLIFYSLAGLITVVSLMVVLSRHPVKSAVFLVVDLFLIAALYATMEAHFVAAIQVLVYAGAIVVLFLFVIMLLNLNYEQLKSFKFSAVEAGSLVLTLFALIIVLFKALGSSSAVEIVTTPQNTAEMGNTKAIALELLSKYIWPFEVASVLILLAIVASVLIAKKDKRPESKTKESELVNEQRDI
jgi:NADH-quinone oxidoreductase subunit J